MLRAKNHDLVAVIGDVRTPWTDVLGQAWDVGAAVMPVEASMPHARIGRLLEAAAPAVVVDGDDVVRRTGRPVPEGVALAVATSGTTGEPKIAELTHAAIRHAVSASLRRLEAGDGGWYLCLPPAHMGGMLVVLRAMLGAGTLHAGTPDALDEVDAPYTAVVPTLVARHRLDRFERVLVGGDALSPHLIRPNLVQTYGMTETCGGVLYDGEPLDDVEVRIEDDEILLGGPTLMRGYRFGPDAGRWIATGDAGEIADGRVRVLGRRDDRITTGGRKVWPAVVEHALREHPAITDAVVLGVPDPGWGARVTAFIEATSTPDDLSEHLRARLAAYEIPKQVFPRTSLPRTPAGTVDRATLAREDVP